MDCLQSYDERLADYTGQAARVKDGQDQGNLAAADGKVLTACDGAGGQGRLRDRAASQRCRIWDRRRDPRNETAVTTVLPGCGMVFPPN